MAGIEGDHLTKEQRNALDKCPESKRISRKSFDSCSSEVSSSMDLQLLSGYLMKYEIIQSYEDVEYLSSPHYRLSHERRTSLMKMVENIGGHGYSLLYICLKESSMESRGHQEITAKLLEHADPDSPSSPRESSTIYSIMSIPVSPPPAGPQIRSPSSESQLTDPDSLDSPRESCTIEPDQPCPDLLKVRFSQIICFEERFCSLSGALDSELSDKCDSGEFEVRDITNLIIFPPSGLVRELSSIIKPPEIVSHQNIHELFTYFHTSIWNFIDYTLLNYIVQEVGSSELKQDMAKYVDDFTEFSKNITVSELIEFWQGRKETPRFSTIGVKLDIRPNECTLERLNHLRIQLCEKFLPPLSEFALMLCKEAGGSIMSIPVSPPPAGPQIRSPSSESQLTNPDSSDSRRESFSLECDQSCPDVDNSSLSSLEEEKHSTVENTIYELIDSISKIAAALVQDIESEKCNIEVIQNQLRALPGYLRNEVFINMCSMELSDSECDSIQMLFDVLNMKMWNFMDYHLLKFLINIFGTKESKWLMNSYEEQLDEFLISTPVQSLAKHWDGQNTKPANGFVEFQVKFSSSYVQEIKMAELNEFLKKMVESFLSPLSRLVIVHQRFCLDGSLVMYVLPLELALKLKQGISEAHSQGLFEKYFVEYMLFDNKTLYKTEDIVPHTTDMFQDRLKQNYASLEDLDTIETQRSASATFQEPILEPYTSISVRGVGSVVKKISSSSIDKELEEELPEIDADTSPRSASFSLKVLFSSQLEKQKRRNYGCFPSIAINNGGVVVEVCYKMYTRWMLYRVGILKDQRVNWEVSPTFKASNTFYGMGSYPRIAINDRNTVVEVHGGDFREKCYYRVGKVEPERRTIMWFASKSFEKVMGHYPCVALTRTNHVIVVYQRDVLTKALCYRVGTLNSGLISWNVVQNLSIRADNFSMDVNNHNTVILAFQTFNLRIRYVVGQLDSGKGSIQWEEPEGMFAGTFPNVSLNDNGYVVLVHKSYITQSLFSSIGEVSWEGSTGKISWSQKKRKGAEKYGSGQYPSVCTNNKGDMVEAHMAVFPNIYLCYNTGQIIST